MKPETPVSEGEPSQRRRGEEDSRALERAWERREREMGREEKVEEGRRVLEVDWREGAWKREGKFRSGCGEQMGAKGKSSDLGWEQRRVDRPKQSSRGRWRTKEVG